MMGHTETIDRLVISEWDGRTTIVSADYDGMVWVWDAATGTPRRSSSCQILRASRSVYAMVPAADRGSRSWAIQVLRNRLRLAGRGRPRYGDHHG